MTTETPAPVTAFPYSSAKLPEVGAITIPFAWVLVDYLLSLPSIDFDREGLSLESNRAKKRKDWGYEQLKESIQQYGYMDPVFVYREGNTPGGNYCGSEMLGNGHHRVVAAYDLGYDYIPVTYDDDYQWEENGPTSMCYNVFSASSES